MSSPISNIFTSEDIEYIYNLPEVIQARERAASSNVVYFKISVTEPIREALQMRLGLNLSSVTEIPMRWIKGDTAPHIDRGASAFEHTYLVYLNNSPGEFVLGSQSYPITANTGFVFNEGLLHETHDTGLEPRLLVGPMNELAEPVGTTTIFYYNTYAEAISSGTSIYIAYSNNNYILGSVTDGSINGYTSWRIAKWSIDPNPVPKGIYNNGFDLSTLTAFPTTSFYVYPSTPCLLEGTRVLCLINGYETYRSIETLTPGTLVKTSRDGYKKVELIGKGTLQNPGTNERIEDRLYKCSPANYPELKENLYITGAHSILVDSLTTVQREETIRHLGQIFVTDKKYRLMACVDERAEPWNSEGLHPIWHLALENEDVRMNYGIYVNGSVDAHRSGLLVETCSINMLRNKSNMTIV